MKRKIIVVATAFDRSLIEKLGGQQHLLSLIQRAGADGVEIRRELFTHDQLTELPQLANAIIDHQLIVYYSVPEPLFTSPGVLNPQLALFQQEAQQLNACAIKFSLGAGAGELLSSELDHLLSGCCVPLLIENDQTENGKIYPMQAFFTRHSQLANVQGMTFDMANWLWVGESALGAAKNLSQFVSYCHVKAARLISGRWHAISLFQSDNEWRQLLALMPEAIPLGIEFPLTGADLESVTRDYVALLRNA